MNVRTVTHDDLTERDRLLSAIAEAQLELEDLRRRLKTKGDEERAGRLWLAAERLREAARIVSEEWR